MRRPLRLEGADLRRFRGIRTQRPGNGAIEDAGGVTQLRTSFTGQAGTGEMT